MWSNVLENFGADINNNNNNHIDDSGEKKVFVHCWKYCPIRFVKFLMKGKEIK